MKELFNVVKQQIMIMILKDINTFFVYRVCGSSPQAQNQLLTLFSGTS